MKRPDADVGSASSVEPLYVSSGRRGCAWAHFGAGEPVPVYRDRRRSYPGLVGEAPPTGPFYAAGRELFHDGSLVLDVGCGSGAGSRALAERHRVIGLDSDPEALAFARRIAPSLEWVVDALAAPPAVPEANGAVIVDVLGFTRDPGRMLRSVRAVLRQDGRLLVAEPVAHASQWLRHPARRAFTRDELTTLLRGAGFTVDAWARTPGSFLCCVARPTASDSWRWLGEAERHLHAGAPELALAALARAGTEPQPELEIARAQASLARGDGDGAFASLVRVREMAPSDARGHALMARLALAAGAREQALELAIEAVRCDPCSVLAQAAAAEVTEQLGGDSFDGWRTASILAPADPGVATRFAQTAAARQQAGLAITALERVRAYGDDLGTAFHVTLGWLLVVDGRPEDAKLEARLALARAPGDADALELLAHLEAGAT